MNNTLTTLKGVRVGHATHPEYLTGCTFVQFDKPLPVAYRSYGGSPGTYNTDGLTHGVNDWDRHGLFIAGGSWNGLSSAATITQAMITDKKGYKVFDILNPAISGACVLDLSTRLGHQYNSSYGDEAYRNLSSKPVTSGNVGAGTGTAVGKIQLVGKDRKLGAMKAGVGSARINLDNRIIVTALSVVNAVGNIISPDGTILAGNRTIEGEFSMFQEYSQLATKGSNTTISIVGINVDLKEFAHYDRIAHLATHGHVRAISPVHTSRDGDTVFIFSTKEINQPLGSFGKREQRSRWENLIVDIIGQAASDAIQQSIYDACTSAESVELEDAYEGFVPGLATSP